MSYCRFSEGDVYLFLHVDGYYQCCCCRLAPLVNTIFTKGGDHPLFKEPMPPCEVCKGAGCDACQMHDNTNMQTARHALEHLSLHKQEGHEVPARAFAELREEIGE